MSLVPIQSPSQLVSFAELDESTSPSLGGLLTALSVSEEQTLVIRQRTEKKCEAVMTQMTKKCAELSEMNQRLQTQLVVSGSRHREGEIVDAGEVLNSQQEIERLHEKVNAMRQAMVASTQRSEEQITALIAQNAEAVCLATEAGEVRAAALQQQIEAITRLKDQQIADAHAERDIAVRMATQAGEAKLNAAQQEVLAAKQEAEQRIAALFSQNKIEIERLNAAVAEVATRGHIPLIKVLISLGAL